ncbi:MAG TPA: hypothetical protein VIV57_14335 [Anaeromyxobacter sp.]
MLVVNRSRVLSFPARALALGLLAGCAGASASAPAAAAEARVVRVTLLLYSGRPNPTLDVEPAVAEARIRPGFAATKAVESARPGETVVPSKLGYAGIVVENLANVPGLPRTFLVYRNRVEARDDGKVAIRAADDAALEDALVQLALERKAIDEKALEWIRAR